MALVCTFLVVCLLMWPSAALADFLVVKRRVPVKDGPSAAAAPVAHVDPGQVLLLASPSPTGSYYHVDFPPGRTSWIYKGFVTLTPGTPPPTPAPTAGGTLKVRVFNVGQGDAILITCPDGDHQLLIDSGDTRYPGSAKAFKNAMNEHQPVEDTIEVVVASHPHADHIGSMDWVLKQYTVGLYVDDGIDYDSAKFGHVEDAIEQRNVRRERVHPPTPPLIDFCPRADVSAVILCPAGFGTLTDPNDNSVVVRVDFKNDSFLFVGDTEDKEEAQLLADTGLSALLDCDFLKVGHHGSDTSSEEPFLDAVSPEVAAISVGAPGVSTNAGYRHPRRSAVERLLDHVRGDAGPARTLRLYDADSESWTSVEVQGAVYSTSLEGDLLFESDGDTITFRPGP